MAHVMFNVSHINNCQAEEKMAQTIVDGVKVIGTLRSIKVPKRMGISGMFGNYICVNYNSNAVRDLILEVGQELKLTVVHV